MPYNLFLTDRRTQHHWTRCREAQEPDTRVSLPERKGQFRALLFFFEFLHNALLCGQNSY